MKISLLVLALLATETSNRLFAQSEPEYLMEIGGGLGLAAYEGDFNGSITHGNQPSAELILRRLFNPRQGIKLQLGYGRLKGSSEQSNTVYPDYNTPQYRQTDGTTWEFSNSFYDLNATYEYNFWPFGTGKEYRGAQRVTPFIFFGLGVTCVTGNNSVVTMNAPIGLGVKYKLSSRVNLNIDWAMHFTMSDMLDGVKDPYRVESTGVFKNRDCYSQLMIGLTYSFKEKCRVCHNADE